MNLSETRPQAKDPTEEVVAPATNTGCRCCGELWPETPPVTRRANGVLAMECGCCGEEEELPTQAQVDDYNKRIDALEEGLRQLRPAVERLCTKLELTQAELEQGKA